MIFVIGFIVLAVSIVMAFAAESVIERSFPLICLNLLGWLAGAGMMLYSVGKILWRILS